MRGNKCVCPLFRTYDKAVGQYKSECRTLLHESYHAGMNDRNEDKAYRYGLDMLERLSKCIDRKRCKR